MGYRVPMEASKFLRAALVVAMAVPAGILPAAATQPPQSSTGQAAQTTNEPPSNQNSPVQPESSTHHSAHHIQVPDDNLPSQSPELMQAEKAIDKKDYATAATLLHQFVKHDPTNYVGWFDLGFVENALGNLDGSIAAYRKSVAAKPEVFESNLNLGLQLAKTGNPEAEKFLRAATLLKPAGHIAEGQYRAWLSLGQTIEKSNSDEALAAYNHASALQPNQSEPHLLAGRLFEEESKFADAEHEYQAAAALDPSSNDALMGLANIYMRGHRFAEAEDYLRKLLASHNQPAAVHIELGRVLAAEGKTDAAIAELEAGARLAPQDDSPQRDLADLYATSGKNDLANAAYRSLLAAHPNDAELHRRLGETLLRQKNFPDSQKEFARAVTLKPDLGEAYGGLAFAAGENKDYALVIRALEARAKLLPENPIAYFMRASAYDHLRDFKSAAANYRLFLNSANGKYPDQEWQAKHRLIAIEPKK